MIARGTTMSASKKIQEVMNIMENDWFFGNEIDHLDERLTDQALAGITTNDEDKDNDPNDIITSSETSAV